MKPKTIQDGLKKMKEAKKKLKKSLFRWKSDPEAAAQLFEEAALIFRNCGDPQLAYECYFSAGQCQTNVDMHMAAGIDFEHAGTVAREMKDGVKALEAHRQAAAAFNVEFNHERAIKNYTLGSKAVRESDPNMALEVLQEAMDQVENYGKEHLVDDMFRLLQDILMPNGMYQEAMQLLSKYSAAYARINQMHKVYTLGLAIVIVALHTGDVKRARGEYQEFCDKYPEFDFSESGFVANDLITAFEEGDPDLLDSKKRSRPVGACHTTIARCARDFEVERRERTHDEAEDGVYGGQSAIEAALGASEASRREKEEDSAGEEHTGTNGGVSGGAAPPARRPVEPVDGFGGLDLT